MKLVCSDWQTMESDGKTVSPFSEFGTVQNYDVTAPEQLAQRLAGAQGLLCNKTLVTAETLEHCPDLQYIGVFATGYNNIDLEAAARHGITVCNAGVYATDAVAQHVFAFILEWYNRVAQYHASVQAGDWMRAPVFSYFPYPMQELVGKCIGIVGYGSIGRKVAQIARAFDMDVLTYTRSPEKVTDGTRTVSLEQLLRQSDIVTLHCPLNPESAGLINRQTLASMKPTALLINTARGGIIREADLAQALEQGTIAGACLDVLQQEPMAANCPLRGVKNCIFTPHVAWAPQETRQRLLQITVENLRCYLQGTPQNVVCMPEKLGKECGQT